MNSRIVAEVKPYVASASLAKTALFPSSRAGLALAGTATGVVPRGVQGFAGGSAGANIPMSPGWATFDRVQGRRKNDLIKLAGVVGGQLRAPCRAPVIDCCLLYQWDQLRHRV